MIRDFLQSAEVALRSLPFYSVLGAITLLMLALWYAFPNQQARTWLFAGTTWRSVGRVEGFAMRFLFAWMLWFTFHADVDYHTVNPDQRSGLAHFMDVTVFSRPDMVAVKFWCVSVALLVYVAGVEYAVSLTLLLFFHCGQFSLFNSQGFPHHGYQVLGLALLAQTLVAWVVLAARLQARLRKSTVPHFAASGNWTWFWYLSLTFFVATYVMTAVTKHRASDGKWLKNSHYFSGQIVKTHRQNYYKSLDEQFLKGVPPAPVAQPDPSADRYRHPVPAQAEWMRANTNLTRIIMGSGLLLEFCAFLALINRFWAAALGAAIIAFHYSVEWLMALTFDWNRYIAFVFLVNLPGLLILFLKSRKPRTPAGEGVGDPIPVS